MSGASLVGPNPFEGLGTSPRANAASASWTETGMCRSLRSRSANPMWSLCPWVRTSVGDRPSHRCELAGEIAVQPGHPRVDDGDLVRFLDEVRIDDAAVPDAVDAGCDPHLEPPSAADRGTNCSILRPVLLSPPDR